MGDSHPKTADIRYELGNFHMSVGDWKYGKEKNYQMSEDYLKDALDSQQSSLGEKHPDVARTLTRLGALHIECQRFSQAESCLKKSLAIREEKLGEKHTRVNHTIYYLFKLYTAQKRWKEALACCLKAIPITKAVYGGNSVELADVYSRTAKTSVSAGDKKEAR